MSTVNRKDFVRQLAAEGCYLKKYGRSHDLYLNPRTGKTAPVPGHSNLTPSLCSVIRKHLGLR